MSFVDTYLEHHGVKGMRWGVRRRSGGVTTGRFGRSPKPAPSEDKVRAETAKAKIGRRGNTDALSNQELQTVIARMNLEQQIARYSSNQKKTVMQLIANTGKDELVKFASGKETKIIGTALALKGINSKSVGRHVKKK
jgi:hypothetical protein